MMLPKPKRERDETALEIVRELPCAACGKSGPSVPHHPTTGGMGTKCADNLTIPLCAACHREVHDSGKRTFNDKYPALYDNARGLILAAWARERDTEK